MTEYTNLDLSRRLADAGFLKHVRTQPDHQVEYGPCDGSWWERAVGQDLHGNGKFDFKDYGICGEGAPDQYGGIRCHMYAAYRSDTLLSWLLSHGDSIEITPDLDGFNCTYWVKHEDYNGINIFLCDALAEVILQVLAREAKHD